jgi:nucleoside-diphosphate-sugar epimerase
MGKERAIIAGCGYVGKKLASRLKSEGYSVATIVRSIESCNILAQDYTCYNIDLDSDESLPKLDFTDAVLFYFIPPPAQGITDSRIARFLSLIPSQQALRKIVLISTTGVYGNCGEEWVDEERIPAPDTDRARRRLDAENVLTEWCHKRALDCVILRVPGIYGPDKLPVKRLQEKKPVLDLSESPWSNRIHIDDLVQSCINAMHYAGEFRVFNVSDGHPSSMTDFFLSVATALNLPLPPQISLEECKAIFSENMMSYLLESKKIKNERLLKALNVQIKYPTLQQGLAHLDEGDSQVSG